jgi:hypothetical protein
MLRLAATLAVHSTADRKRWLRYCNDVFEIALKTEEEARKTTMTTSNPKLKPLICSICHKPIPTRNGWAGGNDAEPINSGRCCDECDQMHVIPERIRLI